MVNFRKIFSDELLKGSFILLILMNLGNFIQYLYQFFMARMLSPSDYGILSVLMAIVYIFGVPSEAIQTIISKYTSKFNVKKEFGKIKFLFGTSLKRALLFAFVIYLLYIPFAIFFSHFVNISLDLVLIIGILIFGVLTAPVLRGVLQGRRKFKLLGTSLIIEALLKLLIGVFAVYIGFRVYGASAGLVLSSFVALLISFLFIKEITKARLIKTKTEGIYSYGIPVFLVALTVTLMASLDVIFVKRFFPAEIVGSYAVISLLGKMIFWGTWGIGKAMFPITSENVETGNKTLHLFKKAFLMIVGLCAIAVIIYWLFPTLIISLFFGARYAGISGLLVYVAIALSFLALTNLSLIYALAINKKGVGYFLGFVALEIIVFSLFHSTLTVFAMGFAIANFIMFVTSLIFVIRHGKEAKHNNPGP